MKKTARLGVPAALFALLCPAAAARTGPRPPTAVQLALRRGDAREMLVSTTFGLLISRDGGDHFRLVCPTAIGYRAFHPHYAVAPNGDIYATTSGGLRRSDDGGCTWKNVGDPLAGTWIADVDVGPRGRVWVATADENRANDVYVSDHGRTFASAGLHTETAWYKSVKVAPTDPDRVYAASYRVNGRGGKAEAMLYRTDDGGSTWKQLDVDALSFGTVPQLYVAGISPRNPDVVFVRVTDAVDTGAPEECMDARDSLYRSGDGGRHFAKVLTLRGCINAFVIERDGRTAIAGTAIAGVRVSTDSGVTWTDHIGQLRMRCAGQRSDGVVLACGANWKPDRAALSRRAGGRRWHAVLRFGDIAGPLACPAGTVQHDTCAALRWPAMCAALGACRSGARHLQAPPPHRPRAAPHHTPRRRGDCSGGGCAIGLGAVLVALSLRRRPRRRRSP